MTDLARLIESRDTIIVVGPGGVGKTTTSAALAVHAARMGQKVLVLTVDPARRLATALGLGELGHDECRVAPAHFAEAGVSLGSGALYAMMLDTKTTFDALVVRHAPTPEARDKILSNRYYQQASTALAGSQEYMAMEKLYELRAERDYDLVVLDTPPAVNAADFFSAPERLIGFLDSGSLRFLMAGARRASKLGFGLFNPLIERVMNRFIGAQTFVDLLGFIESFGSMFGGFSDRARSVATLLHAPSTAFVVVTSTDVSALDEAISLRDQFARERMPFEALVVNRMRAPYLDADALEGLSDRLLASTSGVAALRLYEERQLTRACRRVERACRDYAVLARVDAERVRDLADRLGGDGDQIWTVPLFDRDVHDIESLAAFADHVFAG
ncbi:MAG: ArsA-related P-loop ATPase [Myxococcota bacterium]|jgi:anion-transporting  ArsA/GET3 family ATPase|nr:ArsA-related P-loop ATPase [Myxococcota bacterium]